MAEVETPDPVPLTEAERLEALESYRVLDSAAEPDFDAIVELVAMRLEVPFALISLIAEHRQWSKASFGLPGGSTPRDKAFCGVAMYSDGPFVIRDTHLDTRFATNPMVVGEPGIRFYAGIPLIDAGGARLGSLCAIDRRPRDPSDAQISFMEKLAGQVVRLLELRRASARLAASLARVRVLEAVVPICPSCKSVREGDDYWSRVEDFVFAEVGVDCSHRVCPGCYAEHYGHLEG